MRAVTFKLRDTTVQYDGEKLKHVSGPRNMFVIAQADCELIENGVDPEARFSYQPDPVTDTAEILIKRYDGRMVRPASAQKIVPGRIY